METNKHDEEISMKELIEMCIRSKRIIIFSVSICIIISVILSYYVITPVYESKISFVLNPIHISSGLNLNSQIILSGESGSEQENNIETRIRLLNSIVSQLQYPVYDALTMSKFMSGTEYLSEILEANGIDINSYKYKKNIKITLDEKSGVVAISVKYKDADSVVKVSNDIMERLPAYMISRVSKDLDSIEAFLNGEIESERATILIWEKRVSQLDASSPESGIEDTSESQKYTRDEINRNIRISRQTLETYQLVKRELSSIRKIDISAQMNMTQIEANQLPLKAIYPRKSMNTVASAVVGLMLGVLISYFIDHQKRKLRSFSDWNAK